MAKSGNNSRSTVSFAPNMEQLARIKDEMNSEEAVKETPTAGYELSDRDEEQPPIVKEEPKEPEFDKAELLDILDSLLHKGYAVMPFMLRKIPVVFKSRFAWEDAAVMEFVEESVLNTDTGVKLVLSYAFLAASLVEFGENKFPPRNQGTKEELKADFRERLEFIQSLSSPVTGLLERKLKDFDNKQSYVIEHFDDLLKDF